MCCFNQQHLLMLYIKYLRDIAEITRMSAIFDSLHNLFIYMSFKLTKKDDNFVFTYITETLEYIPLIARDNCR